MTDQKTYPWLTDKMVQAAWDAWVAAPLAVPHRFNRDCIEAALSALPELVERELYDALRARVAELERPPLAADEPLTDDECRQLNAARRAAIVEPIPSEWVDIRAMIAKYRTLRPARAASVRMPTVEEAHDAVREASFAGARSDDYIYANRADKFNARREAIHRILCEHVSRWAGAGVSSPPAGARHAELCRFTPGTFKSSMPIPPPGAPEPCENVCPSARFDNAVNFGGPGAPAIPPMPEARSDGRNVVLGSAVDRNGGGAPGFLSCRHPEGAGTQRDLNRFEINARLLAGDGVVVQGDPQRWIDFCTSGPVRLPEKAPTVRSDWVVGGPGSVYLAPAAKQEDAEPIVWPTSPDDSYCDSGEFAPDALVFARLIHALNMNMRHGFELLLAAAKRRAGGGQ